MASRSACATVVRPSIPWVSAVLGRLVLAFIQLARPLALVAILCPIPCNILRRAADCRACQRRGVCDSVRDGYSARACQRVDSRACGVVVLAFVINIRVPVKDPIVRMQELRRARVGPGPGRVGPGAVMRRLAVVNWERGSRTIATAGPARDRQLPRGLQARTYREMHRGASRAQGRKQRSYANAGAMVQGERGTLRRAAPTSKKALSCPRT